MDAVKFINERNRMCKSFGDRCEGCPAFGTDEDALCCAVEKESSLDATAQITIVEEWSAAHPLKTRQSEFLKMYPYTFINELYGFIEKCPADLIPNYRDDTGHCNRRNINCIDCRREFWLKEIE